ncbi:MAG: YitT family protein [Odoribacteraceae bacterium]|nr:YitT family protein [Odoribacteraceae bacterium]
MGFSLLKERPFSREWFMTYALLAGGAFVLAFGYSCFMAPYRIVPGGIYGISIVLHHTWGFPIGLAALCFNLPLSLLGTRVLGPHFGVKTFVCFLLVALFSDTIPWLLSVATGAPVDDPLGLGDEVLLACVFGGAVMGAGVGMILKTRSSSGGTDVVSAILHRWTRRPMGQLQMMVDSGIVVFGFLVFQDWKVPMYSWLSIFLMGKTIDLILQGFSNEKTFFIISDKVEELRRFILDGMKRGGSIVPMQGMYNRREKEMIMTVVSRREMMTLQHAIYKIDPAAFVTIIDAKEILGEGFKRLGDEE